MTSLAVGAAALPAAVETAWSPKEWTAQERANVGIVESFLRAWEEKNAEAIAGLLAAESKSRVGAHTPAPAANVTQLKANATKFFSASSVKFKTLETVAQGPMVVNNRIDRITSAKGQQDLYYLGVFFLKDGKIVEWSDYEVAPPTPVKPGQPL